MFAPFGNSWHLYQKHYIPFNDVENIFSNNIDPIYPRGYTPNTLLKSIAIALKLDYKAIFLLGADWNFTKDLSINDNGELCSEYEHHYGRECKNLSTSFSSTAHFLHHLSIAYWHTRKLSDSRIINVTNGSLLDAFARVKSDYFIDFLSTKDIDSFLGNVVSTD